MTNFWCCCCSQDTLYIPFLIWNQLTLANQQFLELHFIVILADFLTPYQLDTNTRVLSGWYAKFCRSGNVNRRLQFIHELDSIIN